MWMSLWITCRGESEKGGDIHIIHFFHLSGARRRPRFFL